MTYVLDSSTVSLLLRGDRNPQVVDRYERETGTGTEFVLCPVVAYEVRRGLEQRDAGRQSAHFAVLERAWAWDELERADWLLAARLWAQRAAEGRPTGDADLLTAAHATRLGATIVTSNVRHFDGLGVTVEDWKAGTT